MASYSIGDVADKCGINPVTLRAWQRRYGLLKPLRSEGGHRQFDEADIQRIEEIQRWIKSGISVSKVKAILDTNQGAVDKGWITQQEELITILRCVRPDDLRFKIVEYSQQFDAATLIDHVYIPVRQRLGFEQNTVRNICGLLDGALIEYVANQLILSRKRKGKPALLISWDDPDRTSLWLEAWRLSTQGWHIDLLAEPVELPRPEFFPGHHIFVWAGKLITSRQKEQLEYWREQGYSIFHHNPDLTS